MTSITYNTMMDQMDKGAYTEPAAKITIGNLYARQLITADEFNALMERADKLDANTVDGDTLAKIVALETSVASLVADVESIKQTMEQGGTVVPNPEPGQTGGENDPIDAVRGMTYYKDLYYRDPDDGQVYQCFRDVDSKPGSGIALAYLPHELVNIYFYFVRVS